MIELQNAEKLYGRTRAQQKKGGRGFQEVTLSIPDGQVVGLFGENGAGKSTLLRAMAGITDLTHGQILFDGRPIQEQYDQLDAVQRQRMALRTIALETPGQPLPLAQLPPVEPLEYQMTQENVWYDQGVLDLGWWSGELALEFKAPAGTRLLLEFKGAKSIQEGISVTPVCDGVELPGMSFSGERADCVLDLGYSSAQRSQLRLVLSAGQQFEQQQDLEVEQILLYALPEQELKADQAQRGKTVLEEPQLQSNRISGQITMPAPGTPAVPTEARVAVSTMVIMLPMVRSTP